MIDSSLGELKASRTVSLSEDFSKWLSSWCRDNETLNLSLDSVKTISRKYFEHLKQHDSERSFRIAYNTSKNHFEHEHDSFER